MVPTLPKRVSCIATALVLACSASHGAAQSGCTGCAGDRGWPEAGAEGAQAPRAPQLVTLSDRRLHSPDERLRLVNAQGFHYFGDLTRDAPSDDGSAPTSSTTSSPTAAPAGVAAAGDSPPPPPPHGHNKKPKKDDKKKKKKHGGKKQHGGKGGGAGAGVQGAGGAAGGGGKKQVESHFSIQLVKFGDSDPAYDKFMEAARDRWQNVIVGDVYDIRGVSSDKLFLDVFKGMKPTPEIPGIVDIDDIVIGYKFAKMDGRGDMLGGTFIIQSRTDDIGAFPVSAAMMFDIADVKAMAKDGSFETVVLHEMGHALGFSADMWASFKSKCGKTCKVFDAGTPHGCKASDKYKALGLPGQLALDHSGEPKDGSYCAHWDEEMLGDELMTPYMNTGGANPLTAITIAAFEDCGYEVNYDAADSAELISPAPANWREHTVSRMLQRRRQAPQREPGRLGPPI